MKIQSVAILGAGAVGCYVLWGLADKAAANTLQLGVVAEGSRAERLRQNGCTINGQVYHPQVWTPQQDLDAGRHTEIDMFSGALMRMGRELGIPTPYNEYTYHMIKALEEKNDGLFDYTATDAVTCSR